jgi:hypothetical protein
MHDVLIIDGNRIPAKFAFSMISVEFQFESAGWASHDNVIQG